MLGVIVSGIVTGMLYATTGLGLVVTYRATRVLNFALGGIGAAAGFCVYDLVAHSWPYWLAVVVAIGIAAVLGLVVNYLIASPLRGADPITVALGTLGGLLVIEGALGAHYGYTVKSLRTPFSDTGHTVTVAGVTIGWNQAFILVVGIVLAVLLSFFFQRTKAGLEMRSVSVGPTTSSLLGVNVSRVRALSWSMGGAIGAVAAILVIPQTYLSPTGFTSFVVTTLVAVVLGGFTSVRGVVIGAVVFSVVLNIFQTYVAAGYPNTFALVGVSLILFFRPYGLFGARDREVSEPSFPRGSGFNIGGLLRRRQAGICGAGPRQRVVRPLALWASGHSLGWTRYVVMLVVLCLLPLLVPDSELLMLANGLVMFVGVLGQNIISGYLGRISLGQSAFMAVGGYTVAELMTHTGIGVAPSLLVAVIVGALVGVVVMLPIVRLSELYFVLLTILLSAAVPELILRLNNVTGGSNGLPIIASGFFFNTHDEYWLALAIGVAVGALVLWAHHTRVGRGWQATRDSEQAARSLGLDVRLIRVGAFAAGSGLAALSGGLSGVYTGMVGPDAYGIFPSIYVLLAVVVGGRSSVGGSLLGALFVTLVPYHAAGGPIPSDVIFGVVMILVLVISPTGLAGVLHSLKGLGSTPAAVTVSGRAPVSTPSSGGGSHVVPVRPVAAGLLELRGAVAGYGNGPVLHGVDLYVGAGEIVTLLGANGAGKTTVLRSISGLVPLIDGEIRWNGTAGARRPHIVTRGGVCQVPEGRAIFPDLTVAENLAMGFSGVGGRRDVEPEEATLERVLSHFPRLRERYRQAGGSLSGGEQQMLAIGRALMSRPEVLLLDEPSLGLAPIVTQQVFSILDGIRADGTSILLVEQNAQAALSVSDRAYVLTNGRIQMSGSAEEIRADRSLASAYLGCTA